ncbi:MAG: GAF domain-containing sensor histidine kinase [Acidimicrobiia bacterium]|nr:GAF domain-containing sensor histidine kinase [Acidimicrobiia bacterium]
MAVDSDQSLSPGTDKAPVTSREMASLLRATSRLNSAWNLAGILDTLYDDLRALLPFDRVEYAVLDDRGYVLTTTWVKAAYDSNCLPVGYAYRRNKPIDRVRFRTAFIDNDLSGYAEGCAPDHPVRLLVDEGMRSSLSCPLVVANEVKGCLFFNSKEQGVFTEHHLKLVQPIAGHLAAVVEQSRLNEQLQVRNQALLAMERSRLEFIASISHELRTPLTAVVGFASELRDRIDEFTDAEVKQFATVIASQSAEVAAIVQDLLVITRAEAGHLDVAAESVDLVAEVRSVARSVPLTGGEQQVTFDLDPATALADPMRVRQVFRNLFSNALRYGGPQVRVTVSAVGESAVIVVSDDGAGIPEEDRDAIFQAYGRSHTERHGPGSIGLGLTVSRYLAEAMGGTLTYDYRDGYSLFTFRIPRLQADD